MRLKAVCHGSVKRAGGSREERTAPAEQRGRACAPAVRRGRRLSMGRGGIPDPRYSGRVMVKTVCSGVDSQEIWPPCATTISLAMARPSPAPPRLVARAASSR